jgi:hypothetical protein
MSKQARLAHLQEENKDTKRRKITAWIEFIIGSSLIGAGLFLLDPPLSYWLLVGGLVLAIFGFYSINVNIRKESLLIRESSSLPKITPTSCPSCGKRIPQDNFKFCPFCGKSLTKVE